MPTTMSTLRQSIAVLSLATAVLIAPAAPVVATGSPDRIVIALEAPLSGAQAGSGRDMLRGARLAAKEINAAGGVAGRDISIVAIDDKADPRLAGRAVQQAKAAGAVAVVGPYNSSVGVKNLAKYVKAGIFPMRMTSDDATEGLGATVQPMNSQVAPVEVQYMVSTGARRVSMLVDPSAYTRGMADRTEQALIAKGVVVTRVPVVPGVSDYSAEVATALAASPDLVYSSTYYPEGALIAQALLAAGPGTACFMGLANVGPELVAAAGMPAAQACTFSGVPEAAQLPTAHAYVTAYRKAFRIEPGVWGAFTYDSVKVLAKAAAAAGSTAFGPLKPAVLATKANGATGRIAFEPKTGNRKEVPVFIMGVDDAGQFVPVQ